MYKGTSIMP